MSPAKLTPTSAHTARVLSKDDLAILLKAGMVYRDSHRFKEARDIFWKVRSLYPSEPGAEIGLGSTCFSEGDFEAAAGHYREALKLNPSDAYAYALLGESQIFLGECATALVSLRRACDLDPKGPYGLLAQNLLRFLKSLPQLDLTKQDRST